MSRTVFRIPSVKNGTRFRLQLTVPKSLDLLEQFFSYVLFAKKKNSYVREQQLLCYVWDQTTFAIC
jgi:hypothetical protein